MMRGVAASHPLSAAPCTHVTEHMHKCSSKEPRRSYPCVPTLDAQRGLAQRGAFPQVGRICCLLGGRFEPAQLLKRGGEVELHPCTIIIIVLLDILRAARRRNGGVQACLYGQPPRQSQHSWMAAKLHLERRQHHALLAVPMQLVAGGGACCLPTCTCHAVQLQCCLWQVACARTCNQVISPAYLGLPTVGVAASAPGDSTNTRTVT